MTDELDVIFADPLQEHLDHVAKVIDQTLVRTSAIVRSGASELDKSQLQGSIAQAVPGIKAMVNADIRRPKAAHYCNGKCCIEKPGTPLRTTHVSNYVAALLYSGIFGGLGAGGVAASRWLSTAQAMGFTLCGVLFHALLPRAWRLAFGEWEVPRGPDVLDDYSKMVRSKAYRAKLWLSAEYNDLKQGTFCFCAAPGEHLMQSIQMLDAAGGVLRHVTQPWSLSNPILLCIVQYTLMLISPMTSSLAVLVYHFSTKGLAYVALLMKNVRVSVLALAYKVWRKIYCTYTTWPYQLVLLTSSDPDVEAATAKKLYADNECCLDRGMAAKARRLAPSAEVLLRSRALHIAIRLWSWNGMPCFCHG